MSENKMVKPNELYTRLKEIHGSMHEAIVILFNQQVEVYKIVNELMKSIDIKD